MLQEDLVRRNLSYQSEAELLFNVPFLCGLMVALQSFAYAVQVFAPFERYP